MRTVDLRRVPTTLDADAQVHDGESLAAEQQDRLEDLVAQQHGLNQLDRAAVDLDQATALFAIRDGNSILLAAEGLHGLRRSRKRDRQHAQHAAGRAGVRRVAQAQGLQLSLPPTSMAGAAICPRRRRVFPTVEKIKKGK